MQTANPKVIGIIPARYQSSRFPAKVLADILGKSLVRRTYERAQTASILDALIIAADHKKIFNHVKEFDGKVVMTSPDCPNGSARAAEVVKNYFPEAEVVVIIQADEPCLDPKIITKLVKDLKNNDNADMTTPVEPITNLEEIHRQGVVKCVFDKSKKALYFSRSPIPHPFKGNNTTYYRHIGVYCFRKELLLKYPSLTPTPLQQAEDLEQLKILEHGYSIYVTEVPPQGNIGVDYPEDIKKVEQFLCLENTSSLPVA